MAKTNVRREDKGPGADFINHERAIDKEPIEKLTEKAKSLNVKVTTPVIGEPVLLTGSYPESQWWTGI